MQHTRVLSCRGPVAANLHFAFLSKRKGKIKKNQAGLFVSKKICVLQVYFTSKSWRQIWWCVNQYFKYTFYHTIWGKQCYACVPVFGYTDLEQNLFFLALFKSIILQFFTILQDKYAFIQYPGRSKRTLPLSKKI